VQVLGAVDDLLAEHKLLVGPRGEPAGMAAVVSARHTERQSALFVRTNGHVPDPAWAVHDVSLGDLVLAYLAEGSVGALPGPARTEPETARTWPG
jgi:ABC-2 type transport system ATP-binding protein